MAEMFIAIATILAIIAGPILALEMQKRLDAGREARNRKLAVFKTLMTYRATALAPNFVQALNLIDVEFDANTEEEKAVRIAWKVLLDHFVDLGRLNQSGNPIPPTVLEKSAPLTTSLLLAMGKCLGYDFDEVQIKKGAYYPVFLGNVEQEQHALRRLFLDVLSGKRRIPVGVFEDRFPEITLPPPEIKAHTPALEEPAAAEPDVKKLPG
jgi:hypothetical protein